MKSTYFLEEYSKEHHQDLLREAESWRLAHQAKYDRNDGKGAIKRFIKAGSTFLKRNIVWQEKGMLSPDERLALNNKA
jgi:hypothetical protein